MYFYFSFIIFLFDSFSVWALLVSFCIHLYFSSLLILLLLLLIQQKHNQILVLIAGQI